MTLAVNHAVLSGCVGRLDMSDAATAELAAGAAAQCRDANIVPTYLCAELVLNFRVAAYGDDDRLLAVQNRRLGGPTTVLIAAADVPAPMEPV